MSPQRIGDRAVAQALKAQEYPYLGTYCRYTYVDNISISFNISLVFGD